MDLKLILKSIREHKIAYIIYEEENTDVVRLGYGLQQRGGGGEGGGGGAQQGGEETEEGAGG